MHEQQNFDSDMPSYPCVLTHYMRGVCARQWQGTQNSGLSSAFETWGMPLPLTGKILLATVGWWMICQVRADNSFSNWVHIWQLPSQKQTGQKVVMNNHAGQTTKMFTGNTPVSRMNTLQGDCGCEWISKALSGSCWLLQLPPKGVPEWSSNDVYSTHSRRSVAAECARQRKRCCSKLPTMNTHNSWCLSWCTKSCTMRIWGNTEQLVTV